jgi:hypothetical protein
LHHLELTVLAGTFAVWRLPPDAPLPALGTGELLSMTRTREELSIVGPMSCVPSGVCCETDWVCLAVTGPLAFELTGVLASLAAPLAEAGISIFAISTYDTDYVLVKHAQLERARRVLVEAGHRVVD